MVAFRDWFGVCKPVNVLDVSIRNMFNIRETMSPEWTALAKGLTTRVKTAGKQRRHRVDVTLLRHGCTLCRLVDEDPMDFVFRLLGLDDRPQPAAVLLNPWRDQFRTSELLPYILDQLGLDAATPLSDTLFVIVNPVNGTDEPSSYARVESYVQPKGTASSFLAVVTWPKNNLSTAVIHHLTDTGDAVTPPQTIYNSVAAANVYKLIPALARSLATCRAITVSSAGDSATASVNDHAYNYQKPNEARDYLRAVLDVTSLSSSNLTDFIIEPAQEMCVPLMQTAMGRVKYVRVSPLTVVHHMFERKLFDDGLIETIRRYVF